MFGKVTRMLMISASVLALSACGSANQDETAKQLAEAKAAADHTAAERGAAATRAQAREAALAEFYAGEGEAEDVPPEENAPDDGADSAPAVGRYDPPPDDAPPANPESPQPRIAGA